MSIFKTVVVCLLCIWVVLVTLTALQMNLPYLFAAWVISAFTPVFITVGLYAMIGKLVERGGLNDTVG